MDDELAARLAELEARLAKVERRRPLARIAPVVAAAEQAEAKLGAYWLSRIGIVSLITGAALLVITYFGELGAVLRIALGYAMAGVLAWLGSRLARRHKTFGEVVFGGGLAIAYFVTYALHFVPAMQVVRSEAFGVVLVALAITGVVLTAHRMQSETVAGIALFLGLHTGLLSEVTALSLVVTTLLAAGAAFFLVANRWVYVPLSTVFAVYSTYATLLFAHATADLSVAFLCCDFALFAIAVLFRPDRHAKHVVALAVLNAAGAIGLGSYTLHGEPRALFWFLAAFAAVHALLANLARARNAAWNVIAILTAIAILTCACALPIELAGWQLAGGWLALAAIATAIARRASTDSFGALALLLLAAIATRELGTAGQVVTALACFAVERLHAPAGPSPLRTLLTAGVALALMHLAPSIAPPGFHAVAWVGVAFAMFAVGFAIAVATYRWVGFAVLAVSAGRLLLFELPGLSALERILTFLVGGVLLLAISFAYTRRRA